MILILIIKEQENILLSKHAYLFENLHSILDALDVAAFIVSNNLFLMKRFSKPLNLLHDDTLIH